MSDGLIDDKGFSVLEPVPPLITTPSITKMGSLLKLNELIPRIRIEELPPGAPLFC